VDDAIGEFEAADRIAAEYVHSEHVAAHFDWHYEHNLDLLGSAYRYVGRMDDAARVLQRAFELPSTLLVQMYNKRAWPDLRIAQGSFDDAIAAAGTLVLHPSALVRALGHAEAGRAYVGSGRFANAAEESNLALRELRAAGGAQMLIAPALQQLQGEFFLRTGEAEKGRAALGDLAARLRALPGPDHWMQTLFTLEAIAHTARASGDWKTARWAAEQLIEHDTHYAGSHFALALAAEHDGDSDLAAREFADAKVRWRHADRSLPDLAPAAAGTAPRR
jgi:tetratricopeptide (TPR) repeat protein